jgi:CRP-like cAMP-binding protein
VSGAELARFALLEALGADEREALAGAFESLDFAAGERLFDVGDPADGLLLVAAGRVGLTSDPHGARGEFGPGDALGANSLVGDGVRVARAETLSRARVLHLGRDAFQRLIDAQPRAACRLLEALLREQAHSTREALALVGAAQVDRPAVAD